MAKQQNVAPTRQITISTGQGIVEMLRSLASTQMYGNNPAEVAEQLMRLKLLELAEQGKVAPPPRARSPWEPAATEPSTE